jgi:serine/threonine protein phosphatase PrpC
MAHPSSNEQNGLSMRDSNTAMPGSVAGVGASIGFYSDIGSRKQNDDFAGAVLGTELPTPRQDVVAAIADGIGSTKGGRVAAETTVRGFLEGFCELPETLEVKRAGAKVLEALNSWIHAQGHRDPALAGMGCTFTAVVLRGRLAHVLHVGDTRAYRLSGERLTHLTIDHVRKHVGRGSRTLYRALGVEPDVRLDYAAQPVALHDRILLCSDGVHEYLADQSVADFLRERSAPGDTARALVEAALQSGSTDNCTALVLDVVGLPTAESAAIRNAIVQLPIMPVPREGQTVDGFALKAFLSDGRYTRLFAAVDNLEGGEVALKFPKPQAATLATHSASFMREALVGVCVSSPWLGHVIELPPGRQTALYSVMPLYQGELLETRLKRHPALGLEEGRDIAINLARASAALHRAGIIHRDIKPDNVILEAGGSIKLIDLGVVRVPGLEDLPPERIPGTRGYMAPEMFAGEAGNEATDIYALGITMFYAFTGEFPYGNADPTSPPRRDRPSELTTLRPDLPAWLQAAVGRAIAIDPAQRFGDMAEFAFEMEGGPASAPLALGRPRTLYERDPVQFWQGVAALLLLALILLLLSH